MKKRRLTDELCARSSEFFETIRTRLPNAFRGTDPEDIHQARVASRKLREVLRMLEQIYPNSPRAVTVTKFRKKIIRLGRIMGLARELDVARWYLKSPKSPIPPEVRAAARTSLLGILDGKARVALRRLRMNTHLKNLTLPRLDPAGRPPVGRDSLLARSLVVLRFRRAKSRFSRIRGREDVQRLHLLRISMKKLRYSTEILLPFLPGSLREEGNRIKKIQSVLGRLHDDHVTGEILGRAAGNLGKSGRDSADRACQALRLDCEGQWKEFERLRMPRI